MIGRKDAEKLLARFAEQKILVVGDLMLDRYVSGSVSRISPEAPVPVVRVTREHALPGGAANVAVNIRSLSGTAHVAGVVGTDRAGDDLLDLLSERQIGTDGVVRSDSVQTPVKTRVLAERQQVVRVDREGSGEIADSVRDEFSRCVDSLIGESDGVIIEDYGKGSVSAGLTQAVLAKAADLGVPVGLDPKNNHDLPVKGIALATPNYAEACAAAGLLPKDLSDLPEEDAGLAEAGRILMEKWNPDLLIITLGPHGMYLLGQDGKTQVIPTRAREVFDVSGAGDTVIGVAMLALTAGASHHDAAALANYAAGVVVGKVGTATCAPQELISAVAG